MDNIITLPEGYISVEQEEPALNEEVFCLMSDGKQTVGYRYDNRYRGGWMTNVEGLFCNQIWSNIQVIAWKNQAT